ncbi:SET domain-containing protein-lysine N-methyltransferase [Algiphilus sp. W345]|uniref:SET domain-containing protein-lysine N-methyltransferase n=1 Tax=Banduia mediterranea TaxID=3075609 RepID=A0ABU2WFZ4_9GAMM|nr:SET domain-containing protein-lysine N-methyltransferase [Algiphilus sp. W345]MDT0496788.1 SET domain-containing protein-lysine N-methyltransferase [Algiphilus sp. W345]
MPRSIIVRRSPIHGNGMFAARDLPAEYRLIQYQGRLLTHAQADRRYGGSIESGHTFLFTLNDHYVLDGNEGGNSARWMNHSCEPNCQAVLHEHPGRDRRRDRIFIETLRPVRAGEELVYDYGIVLDVPHTQRLKAIWTCRCGTETCAGTLLKPKKRKR